MVSRSVHSLRAFMAGSGRDDAFRPLTGVVVVGAGKGGVGTSVVSALLAVDAARKGERVLLVDADETVGSLHHLFAVDDPGPGIGALRGGRLVPRDLLVEVAPGLSLFPGGGGGVDATLAVAAAERRLMLRRVGGLYEHFGLVIVDGGSRLDSVMTACGVGAERLLCVTSPDRIALAGGYALLKVAKTRFRGLPVELVVNGVPEIAGHGVHGIVEAATDTFLGQRVGPGGTVPRDAALADLVEAGASLTTLDPAAPAATAAATLLDRILAEQRLSAGPTSAVVPLGRRI